MAPAELRRAALEWLQCCDPAEKSAGVTELARQWREGRLPLDARVEQHPDAAIPGRPDQPALVSPSALKRRSLSSLEGRAAMIHAFAHIEFNAINLALDALWRFHGMPSDFYGDWLQVAAEEAYHFTLLSNHLQSMGAAYGDFPAHNGLWEMAERTSHDLLARMALVPRTLEARGLDVSPALRDKFARAGDGAAAAILDIILRDEIGHVRIGNHWYNWLCAQRALDPLDAYQKLAQTHNAPQMRGPFNLDARRAAGFTERELATLYATKP